MQNHFQHLPVKPKLPTNHELPYGNMLIPLTLSRSLSERAQSSSSSIIQVPVSWEAYEMSTPFDTSFSDAQDTGLPYEIRKREVSSECSALFGQTGKMALEQANQAWCK